MPFSGCRVRVLHGFFPCAVRQPVLLFDFETGNSVNEQFNECKESSF